MRLALFAVLTTGCQAVFPLEDPDEGESRRPSFNGQAVEDSHLRVDRPDTVQANDFIVATIQSASFSNELVELPSGWEQLDEYKDGECDNAQWHAWILAGRVEDENAYEFTFKNNDTISGVFVPYVGVSAVGYIRRQVPMNSATATTVTFPSSESSPGTIMYMSVMANEQAPTDPAGMTRISAFDHVVVFDQELPDGVLPEVVVDVPAGFCLGASQVKVER